MDNHEMDESLENRNEERRKRIKARKKRNGFLIFILIALIIGIGGGAFYAMKNYMPSTKIDPFFKYVQVEDPNGVAIIFKDQIYKNDNAGLHLDGETYINIRFLEEVNIDPYILWDDAEGILTITTPRRILRFKEGEDFYTENGVQIPTSFTMLKQDDQIYLHLHFVASFYRLLMEWHGDNRVIILNRETDEIRSALVNKNNTSIRYEPDIKADIAWKSQADETLTIFSESEDFFRVVTPEGVVGYVRKSDVTEKDVIAPQFIESEDVLPLPLPEDGKLAMVWHQVNNHQPNNPQWLDTKIEGLDVLSPTWFRTINASGELRDIGSIEYVEKAHSLGYEVWALVDNNLDAKFEEKRTLTHDILSSSSNRYSLIQNIVAMADKYNLDGINIDFEEFDYDADGKYFNQFMKELSVVLHQKGLKVSFDVNVPSSYTAAIDRAELSRYVDYVIIMGYDEHWGAAAGAGSVASIDWVNKGIVDTLSMVPQEKTILGIPFYTRVWMTVQTDEGEKLTQSAYTMQGSFDYVNNNNGDIVWDAVTEQYYSEFEIADDGQIITVQVWLEDPRSIESKLNLVNNLDIAGVAGWKKGQEMAEVWEVIHDKMKQ